MPDDRPESAADAPGPAVAPDPFLALRQIVHSRAHVAPRRLGEPGPTDAELRELLALAAAAPDHGRLTPWRFVLVPPAQRGRLAEAFAQALGDRDPSATAEQMASAREKAHRAPMLLLAVARLGPRDPDTPMLERMVSMGAAIQNLLLGAHAMGYGSGLTSGQAMTSGRLRALFELQPDETAVCCLNIGTVMRHKGGPSTRPAPEAILSVLGPSERR